eukprot:COSAG06_NODE_1619_length_8908_cov_3.222727_3_plen_120_part_00
MECRSGEYTLRQRLEELRHIPGLICPCYDRHLRTAAPKALDDAGPVQSQLAMAVIPHVKYRGMLFLPLSVCSSTSMPRCSSALLPLGVSCSGRSSGRLQRGKVLCHREWVYISLNQLVP